MTRLGYFSFPKTPQSVGAHKRVIEEEIMPYIKQGQREKLDPYIFNLAKQLQGSVNPSAQLSYVITRLLVLSYTSDGYIPINNAMGVLECVKQEFYRRVVVPYEDKKREENGDVY